MMKSIVLWLIVIFYPFHLSALERAVWSGFKYIGKQLSEETITAVNNSFRDELVNSGFFSIVDREYLDNRLLEKLDDNQNYSHKEINALLKSAAGTELLIYGEAAVLPDRFTFSAVYSNTANGSQLVSVHAEYAVNAGFLPFHIRQLALDLVEKIRLNQPKIFNRKLLKNDLQKIVSSKEIFYIDKYEVTNFFFQAFTEETQFVTDAEKSGYGWLFRDGQWQKVKGVNWRHPAGPASNLNGLADMPVVHISRKDALAYCKWAGKRLPTVKEWEVAAGGKKQTKYPFGNRFDDLKGNFNSGDEGWINKKGIFGAENNECYDFSGNVSEWTADSLKSNGDILFYTKGGNWLSKPNQIEVTYLNYQPADSYFPYLGFRCVTDQ